MPLLHSVTDMNMWEHKFTSITVHWHSRIICSGIRELHCEYLAKSVMTVHVALGALFLAWPDKIPLTCQHRLTAAKPLTDRKKMELVFLTFLTCDTIPNVFCTRLLLLLFKYCIYLKSFSLPFSLYILLRNSIRIVSLIYINVHFCFPDYHFDLPWK